MRALAAPSAWLSCPRPDATAPLRLFCLPFAGAGVSAWVPWAARLTGVAEIAALRLPGRESRLAEKPFNEFAPLVARLAEVLAPHLGERYALCGHSMGALLAFELARTLPAQGRPAPVALVVSGARAPDVPRDEPDLHPLSDDAFVAEVDRRYGGIPAAIRQDRDYLALFLPALRADLAVFESHRHTPAAPLSIPLLALGGASDPRVTTAHLQAWHAHTAARCETEFFPGGHFFVQSELAAVTARVGNFLRSL